MSFTEELLHSIPIISIKTTAKFISLVWKQAEKSWKECKDMLSRINSEKHISILGKGEWKLKERILNKQGPGCCLRFILFCVFKLRCAFLDQEPGLCFEPLQSAWRIALFSDSKVNINLHKGYIFGKASAEQNKLNLTVIRKHSKSTVMKCEFFSGLKKKVHAQCTTKPVLTAMLDSKSNEWELDHKAGFGFSFVMTLLCIW